MPLLSPARIVCTAIIVAHVLLTTPARAQDAGPTTADGSAPQSSMASQPAEAAAPKLPFEVAGYLNFRYLNDDALQEEGFYREYSASLFLSKTIGRWRFHAELNATNSQDNEAEGIRFYAHPPNFSLKLDSGFVNYNYRDWLQGEAGFLFIPTYWRTHRYQSTTLTVDEPLIDQTIFPTAFKGGMIHGDKYFGEGGLSYIFYGGVDQQTELAESIQTTQVEHARIIGEKLIGHIPTRQLFETLDVSIHRLHRMAATADADELYGLSLLAAKGRMQLLSEFDHESVDVHHGVRGYIRQGYYFQPSYRLTNKLFAVGRYDQTNGDSRYAVERNQSQVSVGFTYRPIPSVSLKVAGNRYGVQSGKPPVYYGVTTSLVYFFHIP